MTKILLNDENLFIEVVKIPLRSKEILGYILDAHNSNLSNKQKLLEIPKNVASKKLPELESEKLKSLIRKSMEFEWILTAVGDKYRSNSIHQIRVFLLGYILLYKCGFVNLLKRNHFFDNYGFEFNKLEFVWLYAALFHDIGYLIEKLDEIQKKINRWTTDFSLFNTTCAIAIDELESAQITETLNELGEYSEILKKYINEGYRKKDHGIISALIVRNEFGGNWRDSFIFPGIQAMALHNLKKEPLYFEDNPIAFLLMLCDEIQEWDRPSRMWGHYQLINPLQDIEIQYNHNGKVELIIKYDFSSKRIKNEIEEYDKEFINIGAGSKYVINNIKKWSEEEFVNVKCKDLNSKIKCLNSIHTEFHIKSRDKITKKIISSEKGWKAI